MPTIDLGVDYTDVQEEDKFPVLPTGTYPFTVEKVEQTQSKNSNPPGRPMFKWELSVTHEKRAHKLTHYTVLPWRPYPDDEIISSGVGMLVAITKAVGIPWTGQEFVTEDYIKAAGSVRVKEVPKRIRLDDGTYGNDPNSEDTQNEIDKFIY